MLLPGVPTGCLATPHAWPCSVAAVDITFCALGLKRLFTPANEKKWWVLEGSDPLVFMTFIFNPQCAMIVIRTHAKYKVLISHAVQKLKSDRRKETDNTRPIVLPLRLTRSVIILRNTKLCANSTELHFIKEISAQWFTSEGLFYDCSHKRLAVPYTTMHV